VRQKSKPIVRNDALDSEPENQAKEENKQ